MKNAMKKAVGLLMTAALLMSTLLQTGCTREAKDVAAVKDTVEQFIETFAKVFHSTIKVEWNNHLMMILIVG